MAKTTIDPADHLKAAIKRLMKATIAPAELLHFLTKMVYFMHTIRVSEEGSDQELTSMAGDNTDCIYAAVLLINQFVADWFLLEEDEPDDTMVENFSEVLQMGGIDLWRKMIDQFRMALSLDLSQGSHQLTTYNLIEYYTAFHSTITHCENYLSEKKMLLKAA